MFRTRDNAHFSLCFSSIAGCYCWRYPKDPQKIILCPSTMYPHLMEVLDSRAARNLCEAVQREVGPSTARFIVLRCVMSGYFQNSNLVWKTTMTNGAGFDILTFMILTLFWLGRSVYEWPIQLADEAEAEKKIAASARPAMNTVHVCAYLSKLMWFSF